MNKQDFLKQYQMKEWYETSKRIKARDHNTYQMCGRNDVPLSVHHLYYGEDGSLEVPDSALITLCEPCHREQHNEKEYVEILIERLKKEFTPYELDGLLNDILYRYSIYSERRNNEKPEIIPHKRLNKEFVGNIRKWRERVARG